MTRLLVVTAVSAERDAVLAGRSAAVGMLDGLEVHRSVTPAGLLDVVVSGVGGVAAAVATSCALRAAYDLVLSAGIAGGFAPITPGSVAVADTVVQADLGAETADGFTSMTELGWGPVGYELDAWLAGELAERCGGQVGTILSVSTVTGSRRRADQLASSHPGAIAEAMEGIGVCQAARQAGVAFAELRTISNLVGPRERAGWQLGTALTALTQAFDQLLGAALQLPRTSTASLR